MYSYHHDKLPAFLDNLFKTNKCLHSYNTRSAANIHIEFIRKTNHGKYSVGVKGAIIWNDLPSNIRNISSYNVFKPVRKTRLSPPSLFFASA